MDREVVKPEVFFEEMPKFLPKEQGARMQPSEMADAERASKRIEQVREPPRRWCRAAQESHNGLKHPHGCRKQPRGTV